MTDELWIQAIDCIREDGEQEGTWLVGFSQPARTGIQPLVIGLARFQSYRGRTQAALIQELQDYVDEGGLTVLHFKVLDDSQVILW